MDDLTEVVERVNKSISKNVIRDMNILLCELSNDARLSREERYVQQQRLRASVFRNMREKKELAQQRHQWLVSGGQIL
jgi:hypothetical protein